MKLSTVDCLFAHSLLMIYQFRSIWTQTNTPVSTRPSRELTMCYMLERNGVGTIYDYNKAAAAMDMALDYATNNILPSHVRLAGRYRDIGNVCSARTHIVGHALDLKDEGVSCAVYIGPGCGLVAEVLNNIAEVWDIPIIGCPAAGVGLSASMQDYYGISRTSFAYTTIADVMLRYFVTFNYTTPVFLLDQSADFFQQMGILIETTLKDNDDEVPYRPSNYYQFSSSTIDRQAMAKMLRSTTEFSRVVVICSTSDTVRKVMIVAGQLGMAAGDYVFLAVDLYQSNVWGEFTWRRGTKDDEAAKAAFPALLLLSLQVSVVDQSEAFWREVIKLSRNRYNYTFSAVEQNIVDPIVVHFYETILLYAQVITAMDAAEKNYLSGRKFTDTVANFSFVSPITGIVAFNKNSDRLLDYTIRQYNAESQAHEVIMAVPATSKGVTLLGNIRWFGAKAFPANAPFCGFKNENPACRPQPLRLTSWQMAAAVIIPIVVAITLAVFLRPRLKRLLYGDLHNFWWRIYENDVTVILGGLRAATSKSLKSTLNGSIHTVNRLQSSADRPHNYSTFDAGSIFSVSSSGKTIQSKTKKAKQ
ncbi:hypothetical protein RvY_04062-2 [Ramazzottius varieornatus]|uniref:Receptor ligand binding region domain-containing protein n=2 Tax=Ramazzottius varieornatus TaxID=947166 RepID=A0A1D1UQ88_RAMVA|nr:hypothetical protein RvY_04062-2 [Ramazzottius varieornatus]